MIRRYQSQEGKRPMQWKKYTLYTTEAAVDLVSAALAERGIEGIEIEDNAPLSERDTKGMFIDILPELPPDDGTARVSFYLEPGSGEEAMLCRVREELEELSQFTDLGEARIEESLTEDKDWINNWKTFFHPFVVDDILIKPTWEQVPAESAGLTCIQIDPGTAFGTGAHETTQLCIRALNRYMKLMQAAGVKNIRVLDVGTGSGILGIAAKKLGAAEIFATDLDDNALEAVAENLASNDLNPEDFTVVCGNLIDDPTVQAAAGEARYDIALANILAPVILLLEKEIWRHLKPGGIFITSGIIDEKEEEVRAAIASNPHFEVLEVNRQGEWSSIVARKRG